MTVVSPRCRLHISAHAGSRGSGPSVTPCCAAHSIRRLPAHTNPWIAARYKAADATRPKANSRRESAADETCTKKSVCVLSVAQSFLAHTAILPPSTQRKYQTIYTTKSISFCESGRKAPSSSALRLAPLRHDLPQPKIPLALELSGGAEAGVTWALA